MVVPQTNVDRAVCSVACHGPSQIESRLPDWETHYLHSEHSHNIAMHPRWLRVLPRSLGHVPYCLEASVDGECQGLLPLCLVKSLAFGSHLVGLPFLNTGGVAVHDSDVATKLIDAAVDLANELNVRQLQLRHERKIDHPALTESLTSKVHMRLKLPPRLGPLWDGLDPKVRNQVRKAEKNGVVVRWGRDDLLPAYYHVFSQNMRDLGTPVYSRSLFAAILAEFPEQTQICAAYLGDRPVAAALLMHGLGTTEVPTASSLRAYNRSNANMLMYWNLLRSAVERGQHTFDFGRCTIDGSTYRFKKQWGASQEPAIWQYYVRKGSALELRPENRRFQLASHIWSRLPIWLANRVGPWLVRGIP